MKMYRYYDVRYASPLNEYDEPSGPGSIAIELLTFNVIRETKCGVRVGDGSVKGRFINLTSKKKFACATKEEALDSFIHRKQHQILIYSSKLKQAKDALAKAKGMYENLDR